MIDGFWRSFYICHSQYRGSLSCPIMKNQSLVDRTLKIQRQNHWRRIQSSLKRRRMKNTSYQDHGSHSWWVMVAISLAWERCSLSESLWIILIKTKYLAIYRGKIIISEKSTWFLQKSCIIYAHKLNTYSGRRESNGLKNTTQVSQRRLTILSVLTQRAWRANSASCQAEISIKKFQSMQAVSTCNVTLILLSLPAK